VNSEGERETPPFPLLTLSIMAEREKVVIVYGRLCFFLSWIVLFWLVVALPQPAAALEPMSEASMDGVQAQSGIAVGLSNVGIYNATEQFYYEDTTDTGSKIVFANSTAIVRLDPDHPVYPLIIRTFKNIDGMPLVGFEWYGEDDNPALRVYLEMNTENIAFSGEDLGSLHIASPYPDGNRLGLMEEFALYAAPFNALDNLENFNPDLHEGDGGIGFQLETRTGLEEFRWDYNKQEDDEFYLRGLQMAGEFAETGPEGHFRIGYLAPYANDSEIGPATFQVLSDEESGFVRLNLPMEGSVRVDEIGMYTIDDNDNYVAPEGDGFGPMIIDDMQVHHFQLDFRP